MFMTFTEFTHKVQEICRVKNTWRGGFEDFVVEKDIWIILNKWWPHITLVQYKLKVEPLFADDVQMFPLTSIFKLFVNEGLICEDS